MIIEKKNSSFFILLPWMDMSYLATCIQCWTMHFNNFFSLSNKRNFLFFPPFHHLFSFFIPPHTPKYKNYCFNLLAPLILDAACYLPFHIENATDMFTFYLVELSSKNFLLIFLFFPPSLYAFSSCNRNNKKKIYRCCSLYILNNFQTKPTHEIL